MPKPKNAMEIFQFLDKSNCRECGEKTCLAFAGAVFQGRKTIDACPRLDREIIERLRTREPAPPHNDPNRDDPITALKHQVARIDLSEAARRSGGRLENGKLVLKVLGKDFGVDTQGRLITDIHVNPWVAGPFLNYVLHTEGVTVSGQWVSFRELAGGKERYPLFQKRCEMPMKRVADTYPDLFNDMVHIFSGRQVEKQFQSDISVVLNPLPKVPIMVCYWLPEEGMASSLNVFFDKTADRNLDIGSLFSLGAGLTQMFAKLSERHGFPQEEIPENPGPDWLGGRPGGM